MYWKLVQDTAGSWQIGGNLQNKPLSKNISLDHSEQMIERILNLNSYNGH